MNWDQEFISHSENETFQFAREIGRKLIGNEIILITGELGAGKTVFTKGLAAGLGLEDVHQVCSPSYTLINIYPARVPIYHMDLYRLGSGEEIESLGWEDFIGEGLIVIEWADRLDPLLEGIEVLIEIIEDMTRNIKIRRC